MFLIISLSREFPSNSTLEIHTCSSPPFPFTLNLFCIHYKSRYIQVPFSSSSRKLLWMRNRMNEWNTFILSRVEWNEMCSVYLRSRYMNGKSKLLRANKRVATNHHHIHHQQQRQTNQSAWRKQSMSYLFSWWLAGRQRISLVYYYECHAIAMPLISNDREREVTWKK